MDYFSDHSQTYILTRATSQWEQEENDYRESSILAVSSALGDDDLEKFVIENKLGCDLYLKTSIDKFQAMEQLSTGSHSVVRMPPLRLPDKLISTDEMKNPRQFVAVHVSEVRVSHLDLEQEAVVVLLVTVLLW